MSDIGLIAIGVLALLVAVPIALMVIIWVWPFLLGWYLGHPIIGAIGTLVWWSMSR